MPEPNLHFARRKPIRCPGCGGSRVVRVVYGMPDLELFNALERGEVVLGGCCISDLDPSWLCLDYGADVHFERLCVGFGEESGASNKRGGDGVTHFNGPSDVPGS